MEDSAKKNKEGTDNMFKIEIPRNFFIDEFICLRSKASSSKCGSDEKRLKVISKSQSKSIDFERYYKCFYRKKYDKECDKYVLKSNIRDM